MPRPDLLHLTTACLLTVLWAGCEFDPSGVAPTDTALDASADARGVDVSSEANTDLPSDIARDAVVDAPSDLVADAAQPDAPATDLALPDLPVPDLSVPDLPVPDLPVPDLAQPDLPVPDLTQPDLPVPDLPVLDLPVPDLPVPDLALPDLPVPDLAQPDLPVPDLTQPDLPVPDLTVPDFAMPDLTVPDFAVPDLPVAPANTIYAFPAGNITIDGDLSDWSGAGWLSIAAPADWISTGGSASGASDISMKLAARWDAGALYLAFEVTDDTHENSYDSNTGDLWRGDSIQIGLDMANNDGSYYDTTDDFEYGWARTNSGNQIRHRWFAPTGAPAMTNTFAVVRSGNTTTYEVKLPLSDLGLSSLAAGDSMGFGAIANENDGSGRDGFIEWTSGIGAGKNPAAFGLLQLMP